MSNLEDNAIQYLETINDIKSLLAKAKTTYLKLCKENNIEPKYIKSNSYLKLKLDINTLIRLGEKEYKKRTGYMSEERKSFFEIISYVVKSISMHIVDIDEYFENNQISDKGFYQILVLLNLLNSPMNERKTIVDAIKQSVNIDGKLSDELERLKFERYGNPSKFDVSKSSRQNKAILVAGNNLRELEEILELTRNNNIDVYSHGEMIFAHTYPKFQAYKNFIGYFGNDDDNFLLDFANFPGAIFITKHSVENVEYLYRGRLFSTDYLRFKGIIKIENNDYSQIINSAKDAKGFRKGQKRDTITVGYSKSDLENILNEKLLNNNKYKHIIIVTPAEDNNKNKLYFDTIYKNVPEDCFVITFSDTKERKNILPLNSHVNFQTIYFILQFLNNKKDYDISLFITRCDKHTISDIIKLSLTSVKNIFLAKCAPILLKPMLIKTLTDYFGIRAATKPLDDLKIITD